MTIASRKPLRVLVVDGYKRAQRDEYVRDWGVTPSEAYAAELRRIEPSLVTDICLPADEGANLPDGDGLAGYDGIALTGSSLHIHSPEPAVTRQVELMRAIYASGTPAFGSCWGIQIGAVAAGGTVALNPNGIEIGFARRIHLTAAGARHPLLAGRPPVYDAPAIHFDSIVAPPADATILAANAMSPIQAAEFRQDGGNFWGVQYHPEFSLGLVATILRRHSHVLVDQGFRRDEAETAAFLADLEALDADPARADLAWAHGLDAEVLDPLRRVTELRNFLEMRVKPHASARGRA